MLIALIFQQHMPIAYGPVKIGNIKHYQASDRYQLPRHCSVCKCRVEVSPYASNLWPCFAYKSNVIIVNLRNDLILIPLGIGGITNLYNARLPHVMPSDLFG